MAGEVPPPAILAPSAGSTVGAPIVVRGRTLPGYQVVVRIDYSAQVLLVAMRGSYARSPRRPTPPAAGR
ncbi:MAG: hypothetical protein QN122_08965 [Armatimonadota bacterium]|nr:hypothetical protein [Armatimonadota bacterium]MDR7448143.1 hypothetical protein [Armatimonadota bacterium]MDR7460481.1 hypothetical protein [Armatimonadota bacterium]MDR7478246.1 hypothetical protein [Armatimonadota bacterium]MDR7488859.1 hypothetical protein [Armatimonadota bacterium]